MTESDNNGEKSSVQRFWVYKKGILVLVFQGEAGPFVPTHQAAESHDCEGREGWHDCAFASGQMMSREWEPRILRILSEADDLVEFIELLEDRKYEVDIDAPSRKHRPFRHL